ncbi:MAG TPA: hypothetical protein GXX65_04110 [Methanosarcina sp.]|nr:hypothetical protein [Methanosarcina sp.]
MIKTELIKIEKPGKKIERKEDREKECRKLQSLLLTAECETIHEDMFCCRKREILKSKILKSNT